MDIAKNKAQSSIEFIVILAVVLVVFGILFMISQENYSTSQRNLKSILARSTLKDITDAADFVYSQGEGAKTKVYVTIPQGVQEIEISDDYITMRLNLAGRIQDVIEFSDACLIGDIPEDAGSYWITIECSGGCVRIGESNLSVSPKSLSFSVYAEASAESQQIEISNLGSNSTNVSLTVIGSIADWVTLNPSNMTIPSSGSENSTVLGDPPDSTVEGYYYGQIKIENSDTLYVDLSIFVMRNKSITIFPELWNTSLPRNGNESKGFTVCNTGDATLYSVKISTSGSGDWITFTRGKTLGDISKGSCVYKESIMNVPSNASFGINSGNIIASNAASDSSSISVNVTIASCSDYCEFVGYDNGTCRENKVQCTVNGEDYQSGGDIYCTGGPSEDTCCCYPAHG